MKQLLFIISLFSFSYFFLGVFAVQSASLEYSTFISTNPASNSFIIRYGGLEEKDKHYYSCSISNLFCTATSTPSESVSSSGNYYGVIKDTERVIFRGHSLDGKFVYYYQYADTKHPYRWYVVINTETGKTYAKKTAVPFLDLMTEQNRLFSISPDSETLFYIDDRDGTPAIYRVPLVNMSKCSMTGERITKSTYTVADFIAYDKNTVYFIANRKDPLTWSLYRYDTTADTLQLIADNVSYSDPIKKVGANIVFLQMKGNAVVPVVYDPTKNTLGYFLLPQTPGISSINNSYKVVRYGNLSGTILYPKADTDNAKIPRPMIVWLHGGPYRQSSLTIHSFFSYGVYDWILNEARDNGSVVLKLDYSGSYGYGSDFISALKGNIGKQDVKDVVSALERVKEDASKDFSISGVYLVGNSYGGYLAVRSLTAYPEKFAGAFSINGVMDWTTLLEDLKTSLFNIYFGGTPNRKNQNLYDKADMLGRYTSVLPGQKITLVQAEKDNTINPAQADILKYSWKPNGVEVNIISIPEEDHIFHKNSSITNICGSLLSFMSMAATSAERCAFK
ncbi:MAG: prolyl oligopeptidase family serine peptidase [Candidatus Parcubacteria bacterium]|nr:prolyl oligopeptidase family serine peptidase [Candidatus Parcubacteria bacterium]